MGQELVRDEARREVNDASREKLWEVVHTAADGLADALKEKYPGLEAEDLSWGEAVLAEVTIDGQDYLIEIVVTERHDPPTGCKWPDKECLKELTDPDLA